MNYFYKIGIHLIHIIILKFKGLAFKMKHFRRFQMK